ncbi:TlpA disulfide reductase family protein [Mesorhizobium captivum]|uniref:TlpA disulfide reductase family protein n=1 Tax=Mesorhizobium captivum TaxID=3072319 RepID=A0ABU4YXG9_9HYPH|nr:MULTISPECIES: TlpA disulfide reductase family protein [unclassified Mesorhizobium]MDX8450713.1 TlpA disulfide reductase family protein [Mesorhizobium sp. VK3C]MDX8491674.1 TlpA disulfide reductase family protein [Mesorhizobium sp. VK22B]MDX8504986.1 TlpA disulfide reductase family protein [Mesorhizobium sp. VK22E]
MTASKLAVALSAMLLAASLPTAAAEAPQNFAVLDTPAAVPQISFADDAGQPKTLAEYSGKVVLLNIWATWCAPCRKEMPTLDRLQAELGGPDFEVVALSMDRKGLDVVKKFYAEIGITHLALNIDTSAKAMFTLGAVGLPMTLLIDRDGKEIGRLIGPAEWDAPDMVDFIRGRIAAK